MSEARLETMDRRLHSRVFVRRAPIALTLAALLAHCDKGEAVVRDEPLRAAVPPSPAPDAPPTARSDDPTVTSDSGAAGDEPTPATIDDPEALHRESIVIDTHNDVTLRMADQPDFHFGERAADGHTDVPRMRLGGLDAQFLSVWVNPRDFRGEGAWKRSLAMFDAIDRAVARNKEEVVLARTAAELRAAVAAGKVALLIGVEGAHALGDFGTPEKAVTRLKTWYDRGARYLTLTWTNSNALGGSSGDQGRNKGLTPLGRSVIEQMNDWGMIVDVSHASDSTAREAIEVSRLPVLASHSGARALSDHARNLDGDLLRAIASKGGAACIVFYPGFLDGDWAEARRKAKRTGGDIQAEPVTLAKVADHIDHAVKIAGVDHVCLGSDFDGIGTAPVGLEDVSRLPALTAELVRRGYGREEVLKILGGNVLRVLEANESGRRGP